MWRPLHNHERTGGVFTMMKEDIVHSKYLYEYLSFNFVATDTIIDPISSIITTKHRNIICRKLISCPSYAKLICFQWLWNINTSVKAINRHDSNVSANFLLENFQLKKDHTRFFEFESPNEYVSLQLSVQNAVSAQPCVGKLGISLVLLNFLGCNCGLWLKTT